MKARVAIAALFLCPLACIQFVNTNSTAPPHGGAGSPRLKITWATLDSDTLRVNARLRGVAKPLGVKLILRGEGVTSEAAMEVQSDGAVCSSCALPFPNPKFGNYTLAAEVNGNVLGDKVELRIANNALLAGDSSPAVVVPSRHGSVDIRYDFGTRSLRGEINYHQASFVEATHVAVVLIDSAGKIIDTSASVSDGYKPDELGPPLSPGYPRWSVKVGDLFFRTVQDGDNIALAYLNGTYIRAYRFYVKPGEVTGKEVTVPEEVVVSAESRKEADGWVASQYEGARKAREELRVTWELYFCAVTQLPKAKELLLESDRYAEAAKRPELAAGADLEAASTGLIKDRDDQLWILTNRGRKKVEKRGLELMEASRKLSGKAMRASLQIWEMAKKTYKHGCSSAVLDVPIAPPPSSPEGDVR